MCMRTNVKHLLQNIPLGDRWSWNPKKPHHGHLGVPGLDRRTFLGLCWPPWPGPPPPPSSSLLLTAFSLQVCLFTCWLGPSRERSLSSASVPRAQQGRNVPTWNTGGGGAKHTNTLFTPESASAFTVLQTWAVTRWGKYNPPFILYINKRVHSHLLTLHRVITFLPPLKTLIDTSCLFWLTAPYFCRCAECSSCWRREKKTAERRHREGEGTAEK